MALLPRNLLVKVTSPWNHGDELHKAQKKRTGDGMERKKERKKRSGTDRVKGQIQKPHTQVNEELSLYQGTQALEEQGGAIFSNFIIY